ncbi:hypothetical protein ACSQ67_010821 [Phaseolus vulgaris]
MNGTNMEPLNLLELIDDIERLGLSFKFEEDINKVLLKIVSIENFENRTGKSPHETALLLEFSGDMALMSPKIEPHNLLSLELAKLDFNMQQSSYQNELKELSRWWWDIGLSRKLKFVRDRLVETFIWSLAIFPKPQFAICHKELTKVGYLITILNDIYDIYGTLDELELFTYAIERWMDSRYTDGSFGNIKEESIIGDMLNEFNEEDKQEEYIS